MRRHRNPTDPMNCNHRELRGKLNSWSNNLSFEAFCLVFANYMDTIHIHTSIHRILLNHQYTIESKQSRITVCWMIEVKNDIPSVSHIRIGLVCFFCFAKTWQDAFDFFCQDVRNLACFIIRPQGESRTWNCVHAIVRYIFRAGFVIRSCYTRPKAFDKKSNTDVLYRRIPWLCLPKNTMSALPTVAHNIFVLKYM